MSAAFSFPHQFNKLPGSVTCNEVCMTGFSGSNVRQGVVWQRCRTSQIVVVWRDLKTEYQPTSCRMIAVLAAVLTGLTLCREPDVICSGGR